MVNLSIVIFRLPDNKIVLQRRTDDAPYAPGLLGSFGGHIESGETALQALERELEEETSYKAKDLDIMPAGDLVIPAGKDYDKERHFYVFQVNIPDLNFAVYEGTGAEAYHVDDLSSRNDVSLPVSFMIQKGIIK